MAATLAFDVYGTLIDTQGVLAKLREMTGELAQDFSNTWRDKQLEYSFRRGLMKQYENFAVCTGQALEYTCAYYNVALTEAQKESLLRSYRTLPAFADVKDGLADLKAADFHLFAFSNGSADAVETLLQAAGIREYFNAVVSVDAIQSFKPDPAVYAHLLSTTGSIASDTWLISSNPFDVIGAIHSGLNAAWVQRTQNAVFDPWGIEPTITVKNLGELQNSIGKK